jgi:hypothetical protein
MYRQRAAEAKNRAAQTSSPSIKSAFEEVARDWLLLAEQMEWMDRQRSTTLRDEENDHSSMLTEAPRPAEGCFSFGGPGFATTQTECVMTETTLAKTQALSPVKLQLWLANRI